jgi:hypothetical protein
MDTLAGIAEYLGITVEALYKLERTYEGFPTPIAEYGGARVYGVDEVLRWHRQVGRIYGRGRVLSRRKSRR